MTFLSPSTETAVLDMLSQVASSKRETPSIAKAAQELIKEFDITAAEVRVAVAANTFADQTKTGRERLAALVQLRAALYGGA